MNSLLGIGICAVWLMVAGCVVTAKPWRGIVPLKTTRAEVERLLGSPRQSSEFRSYYNLKTEIVVVHFQANPCDDYGFGWNVPPGTVIEIGVIPKDQHRREKYKLASDAEVDDAGAGFIYYWDEAAGLTVETYKDQVTLVEYSPEAVQEELRCSRRKDIIVDYQTRFDEYSNLTFADEKARLDNFVIHVKKESMRAVIQILGPSKRHREQGLKRAARAKSYLMKQHRIEAERILLVDAGYREAPMTRLSLSAIGGVPSRIYIFLEPEPKK